MASLLTVQVLTGSYIALLRPAKQQKYNPELEQGEEIAFILQKQNKKMS